MRQFVLPCTILFLMVMLGCKRNNQDVSLTAASPVGRTMLDGTFIQYFPEMKNVSSNQLKKDLDAIKNAGMRTIVIQWLRNIEGDKRFDYIGGKDDTTSKILKYAAANRMEVYLGTAMDSRWWRTDLSYFIARGLSDLLYTRYSAQTLEAIVKSNIEVCQEASRAYGKYSSFAGWYIPMETWDYVFETPAVLQLMKNSFQKIATICKSFAEKPVVFSTFFTGKAKAQNVAPLYSQFLNGLNVDVVAVQDGVGVHPQWSDDLATYVSPYLQAFSAAAWNNGKKLWVIPESFKQQQKNVFIPTDITSLRKQILVAREHGSKVITFDFYHYMSPERGSEQKKLYDDYMKQVVKPSSK